MDNNKLVVCDIECYKNYVLIMFKKLSNNQVIFFEKFNDSKIDTKSISNILSKYTIITFNGIKYDSLIIDAILANFNNRACYRVSKTIIENRIQPYKVRRQFGFRTTRFDQIDLIEVAPLIASLKIYGGRLNCQKMQDLPICPKAVIKKTDLELMQKYCENDLDVTALLFNHLEPEIELRTKMSLEYEVDLRSKSDAQMAEAVIKHELKVKQGIISSRPKIHSKTKFSYKAPTYLKFETELLQDILKEFCSLSFGLDKYGRVALPEPLKNRKIQIGATKYKIGIGGLHSCEKSIRHIAGNGILRDYDVTSYYPSIILNNNLYPSHLGEAFLEIYRSLVKRRLKAKKEKNQVVNESLKITINGSFGKFGSKWSHLYSPQFMLMVTVTGQLTLLLLIERFELAGISVVSANTDGIVVKMEKNQEKLAKSVIEDWEFDTCFSLESTDYLSLNSRDINNYIAITKKKVKAKGAYSDQKERISTLRINPVSLICVEAVKEFLKNDTPLEDTVCYCEDITKFLTLRTVNGGAAKNNKNIGKAIRWYYGKYELDCIYYLANRNKVPLSYGGVPLMDLPTEFPEDIDLEYYIEESKKILKAIGFEK